MNIVINYNGKLYYVYIHRSVERDTGIENVCYAIYDKVEMDKPLTIFHDETSIYEFFETISDLHKSSDSGMIVSSD